MIIIHSDDGFNNKQTSQAHGYKYIHREWEGKSAIDMKYKYIWAKAER